MNQKLSHALTVLAAISMTILPATAMELPEAQKLNLTDASDARSQIENATNSNYRRCYYVSWARRWWCL